MSTPEEEAKQPAPTQASAPAGGGGKKGMLIAGVVVVLLVLVAVAAFLLYSPPAKQPGPGDCKAGEVWNETQKKCIAGPGTCNTGYLWNETQAKCVPDMKYCPLGSELKVGVILSQTGPIAEIGNNMVNAVKMKADEVNAAGGAMVGVWKCKVTTIIEDDGCTPATAKTAAEKLINIDKVEVIVGNSCSSACLAINDIAEPAEVPQITPSCTSPTLSAEPWIFRTTSSDAFQSRGMVDLVKGLNTAAKVGTKVAVFSMNNAYGVGIHNAVVKASTDAGLTVIKQDTYDETATDYTPQLTAIKNEKIAQSPNEPISILLTSYDTVAEIIFTNAEQLGMNQANGYQWISNDGIVDASNLLDNPAMVGLWGTKPTARPGLPDYPKFAADYQAKYGKAPTVFSPEAYDALGAALAAVDKAGAYDGKKIKEALNSYTGSSCWTGVTGDKCWDANGDLDAKGAYYAIYHVEGAPVAYKICAAYWDGARGTAQLQGFDGNTC